MGVKEALEILWQLAKGNDTYTNAQKVEAFDVVKAFALASVDASISLP